jgi:hypothetical protein
LAVLLGRAAPVGLEKVLASLWEVMPKSGKGREGGEACGWGVGLI